MSTIEDFIESDFEVNIDNRGCGDCDYFWDVVTKRNIGPIWSGKKFDCVVWNWANDTAEFYSQSNDVAQCNPDYRVNLSYSTYIDVMSFASFSSEKEGKGYKYYYDVTITKDFCGLRAGDRFLYVSEEVQDGTLCFFREPYDSEECGLDLIVYFDK